MELRIVSHLYNQVTIDANARAYTQGEDVAILCELSNRTENLVTSAMVTAVGYDHEGWIVAMAEAGPYYLFPGQIRPVRLVLHPEREGVHAVRLFPLATLSCQ